MECRTDRQKMPLTKAVAQIYKITGARHTYFFLINYYALLIIIAIVNNPQLKGGRKGV